MALPAACTVGPGPQAPPAPDGTYTAGPQITHTALATGVRQHFDYGATVGARWWQRFEAPPLDATVATALESSPTLERARARLLEAQARLRAATGLRWPEIGISGQAQRQRPAASQFGGVGQSSAAGGTTGGAQIPIYNLFSVAGEIGYDLDLFGGERRRIESAAARAAAERQEAAAAYLALVGNVVAEMTRAAALRAQLATSERIVEAQKGRLELVSEQAELGAVAWADTLTARAELESSLADLPPLRRQLAETLHRIAVLAGQPPSWQPPLLELEQLELPAELPVALPSTLLQRRPDIRAAQARVAAASAEIGVATANLYPSFRLTARYGSAAGAAGALFEDGTGFWSIGASVFAPLWEGGRLRAERDAAVAAWQAALADYRRVVLEAFADVGDLLRGLEAVAEELLARERALAVTGENLELATMQYRAGAADYLRVLTAQRQHEDAQLAWLAVLAQRYLDTAALFTALGGAGWQDLERLDRDLGVAAAEGRARLEKAADDTPLHDGGSP